MTVFEKIIAREIPAKIIFENQNLIVIEDINPKRATHWLIITKTAYNKIQDIPSDESYIAQDILGVIQTLANQYLLLTYLNITAFQQCHFHLVYSVQKLSWQLQDHVWP